MQNSTDNNCTFASLSKQPKWRLKSLSWVGVALGLLIFFTAFIAMPKQYRLVHTVPVKGSYLTSDHLMQAYVIDENNQVLKYDTTGQLIGRFDENRYGPLTSVDATSPFNTLMFFREFATIVAVDNQLNARILYRLPSLGFNEVSAVGLSHDNYIWFFDTEESKLKKITSKYEIVNESLPVNQLLETEVEPTFILEQDRKVFVNDPEVGILVFDIYGNYYNSFPITGVETFQVINKNLVYYMDGELHLFDFTSFEVKSLPMPLEEETVSHFQLNKDILFVLGEQGMQVYRGK